MTTFKWYLAIQSVILEITWFIMLWWGIHQGGFGIWVGWFICTLLATFSSVCCAASMIGTFSLFEEDNRVLPKDIYPREKR